MSLDSILNPMAPTTPPAKAPPETRPRWQPVATDTHTNRFRGPKAHFLAQCTTRKMYVNLSRLSRGWLPMKKTLPALLDRRHSIDVIVQRWETKRCSSGGILPIGDATPKKAVDFTITKCRETDEPEQREPGGPIPHPHRYRSLRTFRNPSSVLWDHFPPNNNDMYLELPTSSLSNSEFCSILYTNYPDAWFRDNVLDVALEMTGMRYDVEASKIAIGSSIIGQILSCLGSEVKQNDYANYSEYIKMFEGKYWIFIPINDGYMEKDTSQTQGVHWSLIAVDRKKRIAHYVDSLFIDNPGYCKLAFDVALGLGRILGEMYRFEVQHNSPHQGHDNETGGQDVGPCGPFVVSMIQTYVVSIIEACDAGREQEVDLRLHPGFRYRFGFHSMNVRWGVAYCMAELRSKIDADRLATEHDAAALADLLGSVKTIEEPPLPLFDRRFPVLSKQTESDSDDEMTGGVRLDYSRSAPARRTSNGPESQGVKDDR